MKLEIRIIKIKYLQVAY